MSSSLLHTGSGGTGTGGSGGSGGGAGGGAGGVAMMQVFHSPLTFQSLSRSILHFVKYGVYNAHFSLVGTVLILGLLTANYSMIILFIGMAILTPLLAKFIISIFGASQMSGHIYYISIISFFMGYVLSNALILYNLPVSYPPNADDAVKKQVDNGVSNRQTRALSSIFVIGFLILCMIYFEYSTANFSLIVTITLLIIFGLFGSGWQMLMETGGSERLTDIYGIANRLLNGNAIANQPFACLNQAN
jgi:hypothetical protein